MTETPEPAPEDEPAQDFDDPEVVAHCDDPEVVAHRDDGGELPWCIGFIG